MFFPMTHFSSEKINKKTICIQDACYLECFNIISHLIFREPSLGRICKIRTFSLCNFTGAFCPFVEVSGLGQDRSSGSSVGSVLAIYTGRARGSLSRAVVLVVLAGGEPCCPDAWTRGMAGSRFW